MISTEKNMRGISLLSILVNLEKDTRVLLTFDGSDAAIVRTITNAKDIYKACVKATDILNKHMPLVYEIGVFKTVCKEPILRLRICAGDVVRI